KAPLMGCLPGKATQRQEGQPGPLQPPKTSVRHIVRDCTRIREDLQLIGTRVGEWRPTVIAVADICARERLYARTYYQVEAVARRLLIGAAGTSPRFEEFEINVETYVLRA